MLLNGKTSEPATDQMVLIPAGKFFMGADGWGEFESPVHEVYINDFLIDKSPVTNFEFEKFVKQTGYKTSAETKGFAMGYQSGKIIGIKDLSWRNYSTRERKDHPVVLVSWYDASEYAKWTRKRLPSEAEWEKAARGGLIQHLYPWGSKEPDSVTCNWAKSTKDVPATMPVGSYEPNAYGIYDMAGNVWNWCADWFGENYYSATPNENPRGAKNGKTKVRRGASFNIIQPFRLRCSNRGAFLPDNYAINIGFRCVKDLENVR